MQTRVAVMSAIVENTDSVEKLNELLHQYGEFIIGRMGLDSPRRAAGYDILSRRQARQPARSERQDRLFQREQR